MNDQNLSKSVIFGKGIMDSTARAYSRVLIYQKDSRIWKNLKPDEVSILHKGQKVLMTQTHQNGKQTWDVIVSEESTPQQTIAKLKSQVAPKSA